jgi:hypothetical protein
MLRMFDFPGVLQAFVESDALDGIGVVPGSLGVLEVPELVKELFYEAEAEWKAVEGMSVADCLGSALAGKVRENITEAQMDLRSVAVSDLTELIDLVAQIRGRDWKSLTSLIKDWKESELFP